MLGKWWLVTFGTYGNWLPGDPRGFKTWRKRRYIPPIHGKSQFGETTYDAAKYRDEYEQARRSTSDPVSFSANQRQIVAGAIADDLQMISVFPAVLAVADVHVHLVAKFGALKIRPTIGRLRAAATQRLHDLGVASKRIWAKGCHMESLPDEAAFVQATGYVQGHEEQGAVKRIWRLSYADEVLPFGNALPGEGKSCGKVE